jgi:hypothetical protein
MTTKLTLSIKEETVERARRISIKRGKSISKMFEEYLNSIPEKDITEETAVDKIKKIMNGKVTNPNINLKKTKEAHLTNKYGV